MNIDGLGEALVEQLVDRGFVSSVADIYTITIDQLASLERMGPKSAANLIVNIERSRMSPLPRVIAGLGIRSWENGRRCSWRCNSAAWTPSPPRT